MQVRIETWEGDRGGATAAVQVRVFRHGAAFRGYAPIQMNVKPRNQTDPGLTWLDPAIDQTGILSRISDPSDGSLYSSRS
jgi:hypothetical protein